AFRGGGAASRSAAATTGAASGGGAAAAGAAVADGAAAAEGAAAAGDRWPASTGSAPRWAAASGFSSGDGPTGGTGMSRAMVAISFYERMTAQRLVPSCASSLGVSSPFQG